MSYVVNLSVGDDVEGEDGEEDERGQVGEDDGESRDALNETQRDENEI